MFKVDTNIHKLGGTLYMRIPSEIVALLKVTEHDKAIIHVKKADEFQRVEIIKHSPVTKT